MLDSQEIYRRLEGGNINQGTEDVPIECHHKSPCMGTCQACDRECQYLDKAIQKNNANGENT